MPGFESVAAVLFIPSFLLLLPFKQHRDSYPNTGDNSKGVAHHAQIHRCRVRKHWWDIYGSCTPAMAGQGLEPTSVLGVGGSPKALIITLSQCTSNSVSKNDGRKWWSKGLLEVCAWNEVVGHIVICQLTTYRRPGQEAAIYATDCFIFGIKVIFFFWQIPFN